MVRRSDAFTTIRTEGALLPPDLLSRIFDRDKDLEGLTPEGYHLPGTEKLPEAINRSWNRLVGAFEAYEAAIEALSESDPGTSPTREKWLLPLFSELGYGRLPATKAMDVGGKDYPISHSWQALPIHLVGARVDLDRRSEGVKGAARTSPHALVQELLNRSPSHTWGIVSNGEQLRVLRDNVSLTRQAFVEFDLRAMMQGEVFSDFALLWLMCHQSRFDAERPIEFLIERWKEAAHRRGTRALDRLRDGVQEAISSLGQGFLAHPHNHALRQALREETLSTQDYYRQLLRLCYRLIFLFVAEDRDLLFDPQAADEAKKRYVSYFSTQRLRDIASRRRGTKHADLYQVLRLICAKLGDDEGCPELALPALGSLLWRDEALLDLHDAELSNTHLLKAVRALAFTQEGKVLLPVDYRNMGSEELGSIYESLLELHPDIPAGTEFVLKVATGSERKTTGSYYTPTSLISALLDSALDPVLAEAASGADPEEAILSLKVLDPACGSGHFLVAAAHRIAKRLSAHRTGDEEPGPQAYRTALRDVISRCVYGIDVNPMAVELCKISLWMEAVEPGKPLSFLEHRIVCGNSLLGTTPRLLAGGVPDAAFGALEGDDKKVVSSLKKRNKEERKGQEVLFAGPSVAELTKPLADAVRTLDEAPGASPEQIRAKEEEWEALQASSETARAKLVADAWCAAFVIEKRKGSPALTDGVLRLLAGDPRSGDPQLRAEVDRLAREYAFVHPHLAFPGVFQVPEDVESAENPEQGWNGGFDVVLGNPPWERVKLQEKEWFAIRKPEIAEAPNAAARKNMIAALQAEETGLHSEWLAALRTADGVSELVRSSGRYPLCGRGDVNTYSIFAELMRNMLAIRGRLGGVFPTGIATDDTTKEFFSDLIQRRSLISLFGFENEEFLFPGIDHRVLFSLLTVSGLRLVNEDAEFLFYARSVAELSDDDRRFSLSGDDFNLINPNTQTCPVFRSKFDADLTLSVYRRVPVLRGDQAGEAGDPWGVSFQTMFHMANDSGLFKTKVELEAEGWVLDGNVFCLDEARCLPLYEAKMIHLFNHRFGSYEGQTEAQARQGKLPELTGDELRKPDLVPMPRYWILEREVDARIDVERNWFLGFRDITRNNNERTFIATVLPRVAVGHQLPLLLTTRSGGEAALLGGCLSSFALDYLARQKQGGTHMTYYILKQLPVLPPSTFEEPAPWDASMKVRDWLLPRLVELWFSAHDLTSFAEDVVQQDDPYEWQDSRRERLRAEVDACMFQLYGLTRAEVAHVMDSFGVLKRRQESALGEFRTKKLTLDAFDILTGDAS